MRSSTETLIKAMRILSSDIQSDDGVANAAIAEAAQRLEEQQERIKRLEEVLMDAKNKHAALVADVALYEDRGERIKQLEDRIRRASIAFFEEGSGASVASGMLAILEEERGKP